MHHMWCLQIKLHLLLSSTSQLLFARERRRIPAEGILHHWRAGWINRRLCFRLTRSSAWPQTPFHHSYPFLTLLHLWCDFPFGFPCFSIKPDWPWQSHVCFWSHLWFHVPQNIMKVCCAPCWHLCLLIWCRLESHYFCNWELLMSHFASNFCFLKQRLSMKWQVISQRASAE